MANLFQEIRAVVASKGYEGEVLSNITAATEVRIGGLTRRSIGRLFQHNRSYPEIDALMRAPAVIELEHMGGANGCLMTLFLLAAMREHIKQRPSGSSLEHVIIIEEAHNIVGRSTSTGGEDNTNNPKAFAAEYVTRMLAEMRALGEGIIVVDQLPTAVAPEVVKNTGTKLALRQVSEDDREELGGTMLLDPQQTLELARLRVGEAFLYHENLHAPRRVRCLDSSAYLGLNDRIYPAGARLSELLAGDKWFEGMITEQLKHVGELLKALDGTQQEFWVELHKCGRDLESLEKGTAANLTAGEIQTRVKEAETQWLDAFDCTYDLFAELEERIGKYGSDEIKVVFDHTLVRKMREETIPDAEDIKKHRDEILQRLSRCGE